MRSASLRLGLAIADALVLIVMAFNVCASLGLITFEAESTLLIYGVGGLALVAQLLMSSMRTFGPSFVVLLYTIVSHFGWPILYVLGNQDLVLAGLLERRHLYGDYLALGLSVSFQACAACIVGWRLRNRVRAENPNRCGSDPRHGRQERSTTSETLTRIRSSRFGSTFVFICVAGIYAFALVLLDFAWASGLLGLRYAQVKAALGDAPLVAHLQRIFWVSLVALISLAKRRDLMIIAPPLVAISYILMASGNRNDILYPLVSAFSVYVYRNRRVPVIPLLMGFVVLFVVDPWIAQTRRTGLGAPGLTLQIVDSVAELGGQVQPFTIVISAFGGASPYLLGMTMLMPSIAVLSGGLVWTSQEFSSSQLYIPNVLADQGHLGQGFSMIAEMWINFGSIGTIMVYFFLGILLGGWESRSSGRFALLGYGVITVLLVYWARNSLQYNVTILIYYCVIYILALLVSGELGSPGRTWGTGRPDLLTGGLELRGSTKGARAKR